MACGILQEHLCHLYMATATGEPLLKDFKVSAIALTCTVPFTLYFRTTGLQFVAHPLPCLIDKTQLFALWLLQTRPSRLAGRPDTMYSYPSASQRLGLHVTVA